MHSRTRTRLVAVLTVSTFAGRAEEGGSGRCIPGSMSSFADGVPTEETSDSPVSLDYFDEAPFSFNGTIGATRIEYLKK